MAVVALHVAAVEEFVEVGGELVCVAGCVGGGSRGCEAVFDVVPRVQFVRVPFVCALFVFVRARMVCACFRARFPACYGTMSVVAA